MSEIVLNRFNKLSTVVGLQKKINSDGDKLFVSPFKGSTKTLFVKELFKKKKNIVLPQLKIQDIKETVVELNILGLNDKIISIDKFEDDIIQETLTNISNKENFILVAPYNVFKIQLPSKDNIIKSTTRLEVGTEFNYDDLIEYLHLINYRQDKYVDAAGDFAVRGSIIDVWSYSERVPCRLEFDGDFIESIRYFDSESQRSAAKINCVSIAAPVNNEEQEYSSNIFDYLKDPVIIASEFELKNLYKEKEKKAKTELEIDDYDEELKEELFEGEEQVKEAEEEIEEEESNGINSFDELLSKNAKWVVEQEISEGEERFELELTDHTQINSNFEMLFNLLKDYSSKDFTVIVTSENDLQSNRLIDLLSTYNDELKDLVDSGKVKFEVLAIKSGFISKKEKLFVLTDYQIFNKPYRAFLSGKKKYKKSRVKDFASIKRGDYVVHENFGIGQYNGLETIKIGQVQQESIKILYAEGGVVYVNLNYLSLVKKFSSQEKGTPKLSVLGSNEWKSTKKKVKAKIKEAANQLIKLYAKRKAAKGFQFSEDSIWQKELEASFFYEDTVDQAKVTEEVKSDMQSENPMDRLVCGDVGFGKTEIAVRAAFKAINDGKQVGLLVPTTILAEQHFNTFLDRLKQFPVRVGVLSRFLTKAKQTNTVEALEKGEVDVIIGTHRLLSKDIKFKDLGLLIVDEEHRFGVMAKEKLREFKSNVDTLTLTATPIPRTLNMSLLGARDLSIIATPPPNRQPIYTKVEKFDILRIREWVLKELQRNGQIYFVHDRVQSIDKIAAYLSKHIPEINIGVAHGQMRPAQLEKVIHDFLNKKYHMLIATKIIESGLDIPNVNTIIINRADRFGLAELHQLRGRVGRSDRQAFAYLIVPSLNTITKKAVKRLQAIEEYTDLGEGFSLSMRDLEIRGAGNLLGTEQSGAIDTVGFDLYMKLLDEAVEELKNEQYKDVFKDLPKHVERSSPTIDTYFEVGIPKEFMPDQSDRLSFYTALFSMIKIEELDEIREEMEDKFGKTPYIVERLILTAVLRYYASYALFERVVIQRNRVAIILPKGDREEFYTEKFGRLMEFIMQKHKSDFQFVQAKEVMKLEKKNTFTSEEAVLRNLIEFCKQVIEIIE